MSEEQSINPSKFNDYEDEEIFGTAGAHEHPYRSGHDSGRNSMQR